MFILDTTLKKLQVVLSGAKSSADCPWTADYADVSNYGGIGGGPPTPTQYNADGVTNGVTAVDIVAAPGVATITRQVNRFSVFNADNAAITVTVRENDNATTRTIHTVTLQVGEMLQYEDDAGFSCLDINGNIKTTAPASSGASSTADSKAVSAATQASTASSQAVSAGTQGSQASSQALSAGTLASSASSQAVSAGTQGSQASSQAASAGTAASTASSQALSAGTQGSSNLSTVTAQSTTNSTNQSTNLLASSQASSMAAIEATLSSTVSRTKSSFSW